MMETIVAFGAVALVCLALFFTCGNSEETFTKIEDEKYRLWKKYYGTLQNTIRREKTGLRLKTQYIPKLEQI